MPVNHLKDLDGQKLFHAVAYGKHMVMGNLAKSNVTGADPNHVITLQQLLGRGPWDGCDGLWFKGLEIVPSKYKLYSGIQAPIPTQKTFTADHTTDTLTSTAHGYSNGDPVVFKPGDLPAGLFADVIYYVANSATNTFQVEALPGTGVINFTDNGTGTLKVYKNDSVQGLDTVFMTDVPHSNVAWIRAELPTGVGESDTTNNPPFGLAGIFRTMKVNDYDSSGNVTGNAYSTSPARQVADLILRIGARPTSRIDWPYWVAWRDFMVANFSYDYTLLPINGFGLSAKYYNGTNFDALVIDRVDPFIDFGPTSGSPGIGVNTDNISARWEGYLKAPVTETRTIQISHTHGVRVWIDNMTTPIIDQWSTTGTHSATFAFTAGQYHEIKVEWKHTTGSAENRLFWFSETQSSEIIPHRFLYPKTVDRPRYETHPFFSAPTRLDDAVQSILSLCNSTVQEVDGKLRFFCLEQLEETSFHFSSDDNIIGGSVKVIPRDITNLRNSWQVKFRHIDSQYLEELIDPILIERQDLIDIAGRKIDGEAIDLFTMTPHQAYRLLETAVKRAVDSKFRVELDGTADTYPVLPGDAVTIDVEFLNWTNKQMLVLESYDSSSEETADERSFVMNEWTGQTLTNP